MLSVFPVPAGRVPSLEKRLFKPFAYVLTELFGFSVCVLSFRNSLYILDSNSYVIYGLETLSPILYNPFCNFKEVQFVYF